MTALHGRLRLVPVLLLAAGAAAPGVPAGAQEPVRPPYVATTDSFPHGRHRRLFTSCAACHAGIAGGDSATARPAPELCAGCHDGELVRRVSWTPTGPRGTNLRYDHRAHAARVEARGDSALACARCHAAADDAPLMDVGRARPERCLSCHAHRAEQHLAQAACTPCHAGAGIPRRLAQAAVAAFEKPSSHDAAWVATHPSFAASPTCRVCHARDFCASCHPNAAAVPEIQTLPSDPRVAALVRGRRPSYPTPAAHRAPTFSRTHGSYARVYVAVCANCHTRESCMACHRREERVAAVSQLPRRVRGGAPGVDLGAMRPRDHAPDFATRHGAAAAGGDATCSRCHVPSYCANCHDGAASSSFHGVNFVERHSQSAYTQDLECASCHQPRAFCVACHQTTGLAHRPGQRGAPLGRFHDAQPSWIFGHGGIARRAIETCAGCHQQRDCLQCHSASSGWRVNPHGRGLPADLAAKNPALCRRCHAGGAPRP